MHRRPSERTLLFGIHPILEALGEANQGKRNKFVIGWGVVFPDIVFDDKDPGWDDAHICDKRQFPHKFEETEEVKEVKEKAPQTVAGASRTSKTSGSKKVKLTPSQVAIAKKLGLTLEQYAKYV